MTAKQRTETLQNPFADRITWEEETIIHLEVEGCMTTSDAKSLMEVNEDILHSCWIRNIGPAKTAKRILNAND